MSRRGFSLPWGVEDDHRLLGRIGQFVLAFKDVGISKLGRSDMVNVSLFVRNLLDGDTRTARRRGNTFTVALYSHFRLAFLFRIGIVIHFGRRFGRRSYAFTVPARLRF